ncbi:MAG: hypothetical protein QOE53_753 [Pseudonocardiales bacterium]|nr:hypothetical protein [Pseudonocardiales bacterium]
MAAATIGMAAAAAAARSFPEALRVNLCRRWLWITTAVAALDASPSVFPLATSMVATVQPSRWAARLDVLRAVVSD